MSIEQFITIKQVLYKDSVIFNLIVEKETPTPLQWRFAIEEIRFQLEQRKFDDRTFGFVMDLRNIGLIPISQIQEFVKLLESYTELLTEKLIATSIYTKEGSIIDVLYGLVKRFYKTKKPLKFVYNMEDAYKHIDEYKNNIIKDDIIVKS
jgi:hypothetical protein